MICPISRVIAVSRLEMTATEMGSSCSWLIEKDLRAGFASADAKLPQIFRLFVKPQHRELFGLLHVIERRAARLLGVAVADGGENRAVLHPRIPAAVQLPPGDPLLQHDALEYLAQDVLQVRVAGDLTDLVVEVKIDEAPLPARPTVDELAVFLEQPLELLDVPLGDVARRLFREIRLQRLSGAVKLLDFFGGDLFDGTAAVPDVRDVAFVDQAVHRLADGRAAHAHLAREILDDDLLPGINLAAENEALDLLIRLFGAVFPVRRFHC